MTPKLNGTAMPLYEAVEVHAGDTLVCGFAMTGCRGYLAVAGGFAVEPVLGSRSTNLKCGLGGYEGRALKTGDVLELRTEKATLPHMEKRKVNAAEGSFQTPVSADKLPGAAGGSRTAK